MAQPLMSDRPLLVVPNPFAAPLSPAGYPVALAAYDPEHTGGGQPKYIGAVIDRVVVRPADDNGARKARRRTTVRYDLAPTQVVDSQFHRLQVQQGEVFAANAFTAKRCGLKGPLLPVLEQLERAKRAPCAEWISEHEDEPLPVEAWFEVPKSSAPVLKNWPAAPVAAAPLTPAAPDAPPSAAPPAETPNAAPSAGGDAQ